MTNYIDPKPLHCSMEFIREIAEILIRSTKFKVGGNIEKDIINKLGGIVHHPDTAGWDAKFAETDSLYVDGVRDFKIFLKDKLYDLRNRFTLAHELGHFILHSKSGQIKIHARRYGTSQIEKEANRFAAELLMPKNELEELFNQDKSVCELADIFDVSIVAMNVRIDSLRL
ncbi:MAG: hypothetical protein COB02_12275 [Candidatus Cloacimonadota bacterium]|nr:MAG: hypothetical protein COB02_12275 [Candidatus Cloacimonadota bacterium]